MWERRTGNRQRQAAQAEANARTLDSLVDAGAGRRASDDNVIARTSFGMWCNLIDPHREPILWTNLLARAYPPGAVRGPLFRLSLNALGFRNRLSHAEPVFGRTTSLPERVRQVRVLHALISPASADWAARRFDVAGMIARCPVRGWSNGRKRCADRRALCWWPGRDYRGPQDCRYRDGDCCDGPR